MLRSLSGSQDELQGVQPDALVLDLDHALARYKVEALQRLIYACLVRGLVERSEAPRDAFRAQIGGGADALLCACGAAHEDVPDADAGGSHEDTPIPPAPLVASLDFTDEAEWGTGWSPCFAVKGLVFDCTSGDHLQLRADGSIARAWHGRAELSAVAIASRHGSVWWGFSTLCTRARSDAFAVLLTFFDAPAAVTLAQWVAWVDTPAAVSPPPPPAGGYGHLLRAHTPVFDYIFDNTAAWATGRGGFFAALRASPSTYFHPRRGLCTWLSRVRARGTRVILATNSHVRFARFVLRATLGAEWRSAFDALFFDCAKPAWFLRAQPLGAAPTEAVEGTSEQPPAPVPTDALPPHGTAPAPLSSPPLARIDFALGACTGSPLSTQRGGNLSSQFTGGSAGVVDALLRAAHLGRSMQPHASNGTTAVAAATAASETITLHLDATSGTPVRATLGGVELPPLLEAPRPRIVFVGDHLHGDVAASAAPPHSWEAVAVVEELAWDRSASTWQLEAPSLGESRGSLGNPFWDGFFGDGRSEQSHWGALIATHAVAAVDDVAALARHLAAWGE